jgi:hypothetical protein
MHRDRKTVSSTQRQNKLRLSDASSCTVKCLGPSLRAANWIPHRLGRIPTESEDSTCPTLRQSALAIVPAAAAAAAAAVAVEQPARFCSAVESTGVR